MKYYVYLLKDPTNLKPFYVGKGSKYRMYIHEKRFNKGIKSNNNSSLYFKIKEIKENNLEILYEKVFFTDDEIQAYDKETEIIKEIGLENLTNLLEEHYLKTNLSDRVKEGLKKSKKFEKSQEYKKSDECRNYYREINLGEKNPRYGKTNTKEHMECIKKSLINIPKTEEHKNKIKQALLFYEKTEEHRNNISNGLKNSTLFYDIVKGNEFREVQKKSALKRSNSKIKYIFSFNEKIIEHYGGLEHMSDIYDISISILKNLRYGKIQEYNGWKFIELINNYN